MKKGLFFFVVLFALTTTLSAIEFRVQLHPSGNDIVPTINDNVASFSESTWFGYDGEPALPMYSLTFIIPDGASVESVVIENPVFETTPYIEVPEKVADLEFPNYRPDALIEEGKNIDIYNNNAFYPPTHIGQSSEGIKKGIHLLKIPIFPYMYNPVTKELRHLVSGNLKVLVSGDSNRIFFNSHTKFDLSFFPALLNRAINGLEILPTQIYLSPEPQDRLYIITTDRIVKESKKGAWFVQSKMDRGFDVVVVTPTKKYFNNVLQNNSSGWGGGIGYNAAERIRTWLKTERASVGQIDFLLLIGDPDPIVGDVPMKRTDLCDHCTGSWNNDEQTRMIPTDFYYAELDAEWPVWPNKMKKWDDRDTETEIDNMGRISVYIGDPNGIENLDTILAKVVKYENRVDQAEFDRRRNIFLLQNNMNELLHKGFNFDDLTTPLPLREFNELKNTMRNIYGYHDFDSRNYDEPWLYYFMSDQKWNSGGYAKKEFKNPGLTLEKANELCVIKDAWGLDCGETVEVEDEEGNTYYNCSCIWDDWMWNDDTRRDELFSYDDRDIEKGWTPFLWNAHGPGIVFFNSHGGPNGANPVLDNTDAYIIDPENQAFIIQASCLTGWPDACGKKYCFNNGEPNNMSLANAMLLNSAIVSIAATRVSGRMKDAGKELLERHFAENINGYLGNSFSQYFLTYASDHINKNVMAMSTFYGDPTIKLQGYIYESGDTADSDEDGIRDRFDNCPDLKNLDQSDIDRDNIGDACDPCPQDPDHITDTDKDGVPNCMDPCPTYYPINNWIGLNDSDGDGIADFCDNCPYKENPYEAAPDWNDELIQGECRHGVSYFQNGPVRMPYCVDENGNPDRTEGGARYNPWTYIFGYVRWEGTSFLKKGYWYWQPDHDLDGIGDACDIKGQKGWNDRPGDGNYHTSIVPRALTESECLLFVPGTYWCFGAKSNRIAIDSFSGTRKTGLFSVPVYTTDRYCWVPQTRYDEYWGTEGYCTTSNRTHSYRRYLNDFAYSHGSDPVPEREIGVLAWQQPTITEESTEGTTLIQSSFWDWKSDLYDEYLDLYDDYVTNAPLNPQPLTLLDPFIRYAVSGGPTFAAACTEADDLIDDGQGGKTQNPACFHNSAVFARSTRDSFAGTPLTYAKYFWVKQTGYSDPFVVPSRLPLDIAHSLAEARPAYPFHDDLFEQWDYDAAAKAITKNQRIIPQENLKVAVSYADETLFFYENTRTGTVEIKTQTPARPSDMALAGSFALPRGVGPLTSGAILDDQLYLVIDGGLYHVTALDEPQPDGYTHTATWVGAVPNTGTARHLIAAAHRLYLLSYESDGLTLYAFDAGNESFDIIETATKPAARDFTNVTVGPDGTIYFIGGMTVAGETATPHHDLWSYTPYDGFTEIADNLPVDLYTTFTVIEDNTLRFITQPQQQVEGATAVVLDTATGTVTTEEIALVEQSGDTRDGYCIARNGNAVTGGIDLLWEGCHPFDEPVYKKYWFFDYKHSLAGKKDRLYLGGITGIRAMKIKDNGALASEKLTLLGTVSDMVVWDNYLYAATGSKIYVLRIGADGALTKIRSISASGAVNLTRYGQFLVVAETKGAVFLNLFDNPAKPVKFFTIPTAYPAQDVAVVGNRLAIYYDRLFATGRTVLYDLTNIETPLKIGETKKECDLAGFGEDRGTLYLGCWNGIYEVGQNASLTALSGDRAILRDHYERNGMVCRVNNGYITVSR